MVEIKPIQREDINEIYKIGSNTKEFQTDDILDFWPVDVLEMWVQSDDDITLTAKEGEELVGFIFVAVHKPSSKSVIENIWVKEEYRKKGIAQKMLKEVEYKIKEKGIHYIAAFIQEENIPSQKLFESTGINKGKKFFWFDKKIN